MQAFVFACKYACRYIVSDAYVHRYAWTSAVCSSGWVGGYVNVCTCMFVPAYVCMLHACHVYALMHAHAPEPYPTKLMRKKENLDGQVIKYQNQEAKGSKMKKKMQKVKKTMKEMNSEEDEEDKVEEGESRWTSDKVFESGSKGSKDDKEADEKMNKTMKEMKMKKKIK